MEEEKNAATTTTATNTSEQRDHVQLLAKNNAGNNNNNNEAGAILNESDRGNNNTDDGVLAYVSTIVGHVTRAITMQNPLSIHYADSNEPIIDEDVLLVEPDYRWKDYEIEGIEDTLVPDYVKETSGKCACFCKCICCLPAVKNICECPMERHERNPRWYSGFLKYPAAPALEFTFENKRSKALAVWSIATNLLIFILCASPLANKIMAGGDCKSSFGLEPRDFMIGLSQSKNIDLGKSI